MSGFFEKICALVPWMTRKEASDALNVVETMFFDEYPDELKMQDIMKMDYYQMKDLEKNQNRLIIEYFKKSKYVRRE